VIDFVGYGATASCFEGAAPAPASSTNATSVQRAAAGCGETDANPSDFAVGAANPRNASSTPAPCVPFGSGSAVPDPAGDDAFPLLHVQVFPASNPPSTGIIVTADLTGHGGSPADALTDDGQNGDAA